MNQETANAPAVALNKEDYFICSLPVVILVCVLGLVFSQNGMLDGVLKSVAGVSYMTYHCLWPYCMMRHFWRRSHLALRLAWIPAGWLGAWVLGISLMPFFRPPVVDDLLTYWIFAVAPGVLLAGVAAVHFLRSDTLLVLTVVWSFIPVVISLFNLFLVLLGVKQPGLPGESAILGAMIAYFVLMAGPSAVCVIILLVKRQLGTTPELSRNCLRCGYDLSGSVAGGSDQCPECGESIGPNQLQWMMQQSPLAPVETP